MHGAPARAARLVAALLCLLPALLHADTGSLRVEDDTGRTVVLPRPARRIVSLAPHATEMLFAVGAGARIVGTVAFSDYPSAARAIPRVGGSAGFDLERIVALQPDLIVGWASGNPPRTLARLRALGIAVYLTEPRHLGDVARDLERLGRLLGKEDLARERAKALRARAHQLARRYAGRPPVRVFYQILDPQLITVNGDHLISEVLRLCGGENVFADLPALAPVISEEAVLHADPEAILAGGTREGWRTWRAHWRTRTALTAVRRGALYFIPADLLHRLGPRVLEGAERVCRALDQARAAR